MSAWSITNRSNLASALSRARREVCGYPPGGPCDCKYGLLPEIGGIKVAHLGEEHTGCPELRDLIDRIDAEGEVETG